MPIVVNQHTTTGVTPVQVTVVETATGLGATFRMPSAGARIQKIPLTVAEPIRVLFTVRFPARKKFLSLAADVGALTQVDIIQKSESSVEMDLKHEAFGDQCTVTCIASGDSRTGHHPCITCSVDGVTVKLCC